MLLVSACLAGFECRYDGKACAHSEIIRLVEEGKAFPVCPEQLGGCPTPRKPAEIVGGTGADVLAGKSKIISSEGEDVTAPFIRGAQETLKLARMLKADKAILKARSPSCGASFIYDGSFKGRLRNGNGVTAQLLIDNGFQVEEA